MEKKISKEWYMGATYYLTAVFVPSIILGIAYGLITFPLGIEEGTIQDKIGLFVTVVLATWAGAMYASRYLKKTYVISNPERVVLFGLLWGVLLSAVVLSLGYFMTAIIPTVWT